MRGRELAEHAVMTHRSQSHGRDASALRAVWIAPELAGRHPLLKICGDGPRGSREDALIRVGRRVLQLAENRVGHIKPRKARA